MALITPAIRYLLNNRMIAPAASKVGLGDLLAQIESGGGNASFAAVTSTYSALSTDSFLTASGTFVLTLPSAATVGAGKRISIKNIGTGTVSVTPAGSETIDGIAGVFAMAVQWETARLISDGTNWLVG